MPLSPSVERTRSHTRSIIIEGYERADGLFDIEAHLTDIKPEGFDTPHRGHVPPEEPLHGMWVRLTVDEQMLIVAAEACTDYAPYNICPGGAASYSRLAGLRIARGFMKEANARMAGTAGCTHLREMLQEIATTAFQTIWSVRSRRRREAGVTRPDHTPHLNTCFAYATDGPVVREFWPNLYTGPEAVTAEAAAGED